MVFQNNLLMGAGGQATGYEIDESCRFNDNDSAFTGAASPTPTSERIFTFSFWVKRANLTRSTIFSNERDDGAGTYGGLEFQANDTLRWKSETTGGANIFDRQTNAVFRDPSAWYHVVCVVDSNQTDSTAADIYVNGVVQTYSTTTNPGSAQDLGWPSTAQPFEVGRLFNGTFYLDAYLSNFYFIDGQELTPASFGETSSTTGQWVPKAYTGTFGNAGLFLDFSVAPGTGDGAGTDSSGNDNDLTDSGLAAADQVTDTPTDNHGTMNPLDFDGTVFSNGNNTVVTTADGGSRGTFWVDSEDSDGWYFEVYPRWTPAASSGCGIATASANLTTTTTAGKWAYDGDGYGNFEAARATYGDAFLINETMGVLIKGGTLTFYNEGVSQGSAATSITGLVAPYAYSYSPVSTWEFNFGASAFVQTVPTGAKALNTANIADPTIADPSAYYQTTLYTGDGASSLAVNQGGNSTFDPDLVWIKNRDAVSNNLLFDAVRGATKWIPSNDTDAESTEADTLLSFDSDGFSVGDSSRINTNTEKYVGWQWLESATSAFDIVSYTGNGSARTISHNLGVKPDLMLFKRLDGAQNWRVYHHVITANNSLFLDLSNAQSDDTAPFNDTEPTSSVFTVGTDGTVNANTQTYIAYLFAGVEGFSKFGSYTGNGNADGPFVWCGFRPAFVLIKATAAESWWIGDDKRPGYNDGNPPMLAPDTTAAEDAGWSGSAPFDIVSNGFKIRRTGDAFNGSGGTYLFAAFAETPFKTATAR